MKAPFAIRAEDALNWHPASMRTAGVAERAGVRIRAKNGKWEVWATDRDFLDLCSQSKPDPLPGLRGNAKERNK